MDSASAPLIHEAAAKLVQDVLDSYSISVGYGSMTCTIYDTAWVACITKTVDEQERWLSPSSFAQVVSAQLPEGDWAVPGGSFSDRILTALAGLFALSKHNQATFLSNNDEVGKYDHAIARAVSRIDHLLQNWRVAESRGVGFEVLIPSLLVICEGYGHYFQFPGRTDLLQLRDEKFSKIPWQQLYKSSKTSLLHSLEALVAYPDFDFTRMSHALHDGSMMGSPSATAAYLIKSSVWDDSCEKYLQQAMQCGQGKGSGLFSSAFPSTNFELLWVASTLARTGLLDLDLRDGLKTKLIEAIETGRDASTGLFGFARGIQPDLDDSAQASIFLTSVGLKGLSRKLIENFQGSNHLQTYPGERNPSLSANCNALLALILDDPNEDTIPTIEMLVKFTCNTWWETDGQVADKWNHSVHYPIMIVAQTFAELLLRHAKGLLPISADLVPPCYLILVQCSIRTLRAQNQNGSWGHDGPFEETGYAISILANLLQLDPSFKLGTDMLDAIKKGLGFIQTRKSVVAEPLWIEKVPYGSVAISSAYCIAAEFKSIKMLAPSFAIKEPDLRDPYQSAKMDKLILFFRSLPILQDVPAWLYTASSIEASIYLHKLIQSRPRIFERIGLTENKYLQYIPFIWALTNNVRGRDLSNEFLFDMMQVSLLNYEVDEFMETQVTDLFKGNIAAANQFIEDLFAARIPRVQRAPISGVVVNGNGSEILEDTRFGQSPQNVEESTLTSTRNSLNEFINWILLHPRVGEASQQAQISLATKLKAFLLAHVQQIADNESLARLGASNTPNNSNSQKDGVLIYSTSEKRFHDWIRTTAADHTSCPFSFEFASCMQSRNGRDLFPGGPEQYIAHDFAHHLATMCRLQNDIGSIARDAKESNLNSVNFVDLDPDRCSAQARKTKLFGLIAYEKGMLDMAQAQLCANASEKAIRTLAVFRMVTEIFGEIYIMRDIASSKVSKA